MRIAIIAVTASFIVACGNNQSTTNSSAPAMPTSSSPAVVSAPASPPPPQISDNKAMLSLNGFERFKWGISKSTAGSIAKSYGQTSYEPPEIKVKVRGYDEWFGLHFSGGKLDSVYHRFNNKKKHGPFAENIIKRLEARYGKPTTVSEEGAEKVYTWIGKYTKIAASYQQVSIMLR